MFIYMNLAIVIVFIALIAFVISKRKTEGASKIFAFATISAILLYTIYNFMMNSVASMLTQIFALYNTTDQTTTDGTSTGVGATQYVEVILSIVFVVLIVYLVSYLIKYIAKDIKNFKQFTYYAISSLLVIFVVQLLPTLITQLHMYLYVANNLETFTQSLAQMDPTTLESLLGITDVSQITTEGVIKYLAVSGTPVAFYSGAYIELIANSLIQFLVIVSLSSAAIFKFKYNAKDESKFLFVFTVLFLILRIVEQFVITNYFTKAAGETYSYFQTNSNALFDLLTVVLILIVGLLFVRTIYKSIKSINELNDENDSKEETVEETKVETKEETKDETKEETEDESEKETKDESEEESKVETEEETKDESEEESKEETKEENKEETEENSK